MRSSLEPAMIEEVTFGSLLYEQTLAFRDAHLRRPIGLTLSALDVEDEDRQIHLAVVEEGAILATLVLKPTPSNTVKLRQMAVEPATRGRGIGALLVRHAEHVARERGFAAVEMNARVAARGFYEKLGYVPSGEAFIDVTIPHIRMTKRL